MPDALFIGRGGNVDQALLLGQANRHGLIAGATGTGKTVTLQGLAEAFSAAGVPVFLADVKGDLAGLAMPGSSSSPIHDKLAARATEVGLTDWRYTGSPVIFWDLYGTAGHAVRTTISEMGPLLLARLMSLNDTQAGVLNAAFRYADDEGLLLLNLPDLQALLVYCAENARDLSARYGNVARASVGAIQRQLLQLESEGGDRLFGEPALDIRDLLRTDDTGRGVVSILAADRLIQNPRAYATLLLWILSELYETLPEVGDLAKPKLVFFFDEAHLLFDDAPPALEDKVEQVVRLVRSKGVGIYFVTQNPIDIPEKIAGQLGNRIQHALRAYTPRDQRAIRAAADTFRINPDLDVAAAITELRVGEALVSTLDADGAPSIVQRTLIRPPSSRIGTLTEPERRAIIAGSPIGDTYDELIDRDSAEELLGARAARALAEAQAEDAEGRRAKVRAEAAKAEARDARKRRADPSLTEEMTDAVGRSMKRQLVNRVAGGLLRGLLGGLFKR